jgi:hypothetical protein
MVTNQTNPAENSSDYCSSHRFFTQLYMIQFINISESLVYSLSLITEVTTLWTGFRLFICTHNDLEVTKFGLCFHK